MASMPARSARTAPEPCRAACNCGNTPYACSTSDTTAGLAGRVPSRTRLSMFSIFQLNSPRVLAPTSRPLPFSVWKTRRIERSCSMLSGACFHAPRRLPRLVISSSSSSRNTSRISSSMSSLCSKPSAPPVGAGAGAGAGVGAVSGTGASPRSGSPPGVDTSVVGCSDGAVAASSSRFASGVLAGPMPSAAAALSWSSNDTGDGEVAVAVLSSGSGQ